MKDIITKDDIKKILKNYAVFDHRNENEMIDQSKINLTNEIISKINENIKKNNDDNYWNDKENSPVHFDNPEQKSHITVNNR